MSPIVLVYVRVGSIGPVFTEACFTPLSLHPTLPATENTPFIGYKLSSKPGVNHIMYFPLILHLTGIDSKSGPAVRISYPKSTLESGF